MSFLRKNPDQMSSGHVVRVKSGPDVQEDIGSWWTSGPVTGADKVLRAWWLQPLVHNCPGFGPVSRKLLIIARACTVQSNHQWRSVGHTYGGGGTTPMLGPGIHDGCEDFLSDSMGGTHVPPPVVMPLIFVQQRQYITTYNYI